MKIEAVQLNEIKAALKPIFAKQTEVVNDPTKNQRDFSTEDYRMQIMALVGKS